jgi:hypothetical protein
VMTSVDRSSSWVCSACSRSPAARAMLASRTRSPRRDARPRCAVALDRDATPCLKWTLAAPALTSDTSAEGPEDLTVILMIPAQFDGVNITGLADSVAPTSGMPSSSG